MDQEKLLYFKGLLEGRLHTLLEEAGKTCNDMRQDTQGRIPRPDGSSLFGIGPKFPSEDQGS